MQDHSDLNMLKMCYHFHLIATLIVQKRPNKTLTNIDAVGACISSETVTCIGRTRYDTSTSHLARYRRTWGN